MKNKFVLRLCILILVVMFSASCFAAEKILFAVVGAMSEEVGAAGIEMERATKLAIKEINEEGGVNGKEFTYIVGDDVGMPDQAVTIAQKFSLNKDILFVLGHHSSGCSIAALPTWEKAGIPVISPTNTSPKITKLGHKNYFRIIANDDIMVNQLLKLAVIELGFKNLAAIWVNSDYGKGMHDAAVKGTPELGAKLLGDESYLPTEKDYSSQITKFKGAGVDCVLFLGGYTEFALFLMQSINLGFHAQIVGASGCSSSRMIEIAGEAAEGCYVISGFDPNDKRPKQAKFIESFETLYKVKVGEWGAHAYDIVYMAKQAIEMGGTTREKLIEVLHRSDFEYDGITGLIKFDEYGDVSEKKSLVLKVKDGAFTTFIPTKF